MYWFGTWLADYYGWWKARIAKHPVLWEIGLTIISVIPLVIVKPVNWAIWIFIPLQLAFAPAFVAGFQIRKENRTKRDEQYAKTKAIQKLIASGNKGLRK